MPRKSVCSHYKLEKIALQIVRLWPLGSLASGFREPGAKQARGPKGPSEGAKGAKGAKPGGQRGQARGPKGPSQGAKGAKRGGQSLTSEGAKGAKRGGQRGQRGPKPNSILQNFWAKC